MYIAETLQELLLSTVAFDLRMHDESHFNQKPGFCTDFSSWGSVYHTFN